MVRLHCIPGLDHLLWPRREKDRREHRRHTEGACYVQRLNPLRPDGPLCFSLFNGRARTFYLFPHLSFKASRTPNPETNLLSTPNHDALGCYLEQPVPPFHRDLTGVLFETGFNSPLPIFFYYLYFLAQSKVHFYERWLDMTLKQKIPKCPPGGQPMWVAVKATEGQGRGRKRCRSGEQKSFGLFFKC